VDLVVEQLRIADGHALTLPDVFPDALPVRGHSMEFRINVEDPARGWLPTPGHITQFDAPAGPGVRVDSGVVAGSQVPGSFDSLVAKLIITGATRQQVLARARRALQEFRIEGVASVLPFHRTVVDSPAFASEDSFAVHTRWIETEMTMHFAPAPRPEPDTAAPLLRSFVEIDGKRVRLGLPANWVLAQPSAVAAQSLLTEQSTQSTHAPGDVPAPLSGSLIACHRNTGDAVQAGEVIGIMEAMKMETALHAPLAGQLEWLVEVGEALVAGQMVARVDGV